MKTLTLIMVIALLSGIDAFAQKPEWVDNPGTYAAEYFVSIGIAKDKKVDKAREKSEKKATKGMEKMLKNKYKKDEIKKAMPSVKYESYWQDAASGYYYCLALMPKEAIDKQYKIKKNFEKAKSSALDATEDLNAQFKDDVIIINIDED
jgi:hypothetical protein